MRSGCGWPKPRLPQLALEPDRAAQRLDLARAWNRLPDDAQEALALHLFEGVGSPRAAQVLGISAAAYRARLARARHRLAALLGSPDSDDPDPVEVSR